MLLAGNLTAGAGALPDSTWVALAQLPQSRASAIFGLAVDPSNNQVLVAGNSSGSLFRSTNGGSSWVSVYAGKATVTAIVFSPIKTGLALAGTRGSGALISTDGGLTWAPASGLDGRSVRTFGFALTVIAAGTDHGVYVSADGASWTASGLGAYSIDALAVEAVHTPARLVAGSDSPGSNATLSLFQSLDAGATWSQFEPPISGTLAVRLAAGPLPPSGDTRPLVAGTNAGLFLSTDNGTSFTALSGGELLPSTDFTQVTFITDHFDRFYAASDGGGSSSGGLWRTDDGGQTFRSLAVPVPSVTALAVSNDEAPTIYIATFRPADHVAELWAYHDTGGIPQGPAGTPSPAASGARTTPAGSGLGLLGLLRLPQTPYALLGLGAVILLLAAFVAQLRGRRR